MTLRHYKKNVFSSDLNVEVKINVFLHCVPHDPLTGLMYLSEFLGHNDLHNDERTNG